MKVWARYAVPVMVLVDEHKDEIERVVMVPDERFIDREMMGDMLFYTEQLERISSSQQQARARAVCRRLRPVARPGRVGDRGQLGHAEHERRRAAAPELP